MTYVWVRIGDDFPVQPGKSRAGDSTGKVPYVGVARVDRQSVSVRTVVVRGVEEARTPGCLHCVSVSQDMNVCLLTILPLSVSSLQPEPAGRTAGERTSAGPRRHRRGWK